MNKTILYGAFGRHNFGDMLFPHIISKMLEDTKIKHNLEFCDIISRDMTEFGGHDVKSIANFIDCGDEVNVIHVGGEIGGCGLPFAAKMCEPMTDEQKIEVNRLKTYKMPLGYVLPKSLFKKPKTFIANSVGGLSKPSAEFYKDFDYVSFRDEDSYKRLSAKKIKCNLVPDSAVMTRKFLHDNICVRDNDNHILDLNKRVGKDYIAVQLKSIYIEKKSSQVEMNKILHNIIKKTNLPIVFFCAGTAPHHDSVKLYRKYFNNLPDSYVYFFDNYNIWNICNIIRNARFVIGTSLHVRILSQQYYRPRITLCTERKHKGFILKWDNINNANTIINDIPNYILKELKEHDSEADAKQLKFLENEYLTQSTWINLFSTS